LIIDLDNTNQIIDKASGYVFGATTDGNEVLSERNSATILMYSQSIFQVASSELNWQYYTSGAHIADETKK
jgi:hypothetical protein